MNTMMSWLELDASAFAHNVTQFKNIISNTHLAFVVKANGYGHGMREVAQLAQHNPAIDWLCVAALSEAITLRKQGITKPIMVMSCIDIDPEQAVHSDIDIFVYNYEMAQTLNTAGLRHKYQFNVHVKIDTGLTRLGMEPKQTVPFIKHLQALPGIIVRGICSHFSESSKADQSFALAQVQQFQRTLDALREEHITIPLKHFANSAGALTLSLPQCNLVRVGAGIYGLWPSSATRAKVLIRYPECNLRPILSWKARIINIKTIAPGRAVGYDRTHYTSSETVIANIFVGYSDGYDFRLHNRASVKIGDHYAPIIGRISMNLMTIDVTNISRVALGDEVIIMGNHPHINPYDLSELSGNTNIREMYTRLNPTITRIITKQDSAIATLGDSIKVAYTNHPTNT